MKKMYSSDEIGNATVTLAKICDYEWEIQRVDTRRAYRGKGHMRVLMRRVLDDADREEVILLLTSGIGSDTGMSTEELVDWYARLGFDAIAPGRYPGTTVMQRTPRIPTSR